MIPHNAHDSSNKDYPPFASICVSSDDTPQKRTPSKRRRPLIRSSLGEHTIISNARTGSFRLTRLLATVAAAALATMAAMPTNTHGSTPMDKPAEASPSDGRYVGAISL
eukprot:1183208-Prorocentrum_minimum.AAC.4